MTSVFPLKTMGIFFHLFHPYPICTFSEFFLLRLSLSVSRFDLWDLVLRLLLHRGHSPCIDLFGGNLGVMQRRITLVGTNSSTTPHSTSLAWFSHQLATGFLNTEGKIKHCSLSLVSALFAFDHSHFNVLIIVISSACTTCGPYFFTQVVLRELCQVGLLGHFSLKSYCGAEKE